MKASELVRELQQAIANHGDLNILVRDPENGMAYTEINVNPDPASPMEILEGIEGTIDINYWE